MKNNQTLLKSILSSIISVAIFWLCINPDINHFTAALFPSINLPAMAVSIVTSILLFILSRSISVKLPQSVIIAGFLILAAFLLVSYGMENDPSGRSDKIGVELFAPTYIFYIIIILLCLLLSAAVQKKHSAAPLIISEKLQNPAGLSNLAIYITSLILVIISVYNHYKLNFVSEFNSHHAHAYLNSITNIFWGIPYSGSVNSIYGHYGFFYYPFLKLAYSCGMHNLYKVCLILSTALVALTLLIWIKVLCRNVQSKLIQFLGILMICHTFASRLINIYYQRDPHRSFPLAVTILLIDSWYRSNGSKRQILTITGYLYCVFAIIWNTEYGMFSLIAWSALHICTALQSNKPNFIKITKHLAAIPSVFLCSLALCGLFNKLWGGEMLSWKDFIFPILQSSYMEGFLELQLPVYPSAWMSITSLFLAFLTYGLKDTILYSKNCRRNDRSAVFFSAAVLGLGAVSYAINRPAYRNFFIIMPLAAFLISIIADTFAEDRSNVFQAKSTEQLIKSLSGLISLFVLFITAVSTVINIPYNLEQSSFYKDDTEIKDAINWINQRNDKDALPVGGAISLIYTYMGKDPGFYTMDISDMKTDPRFTEYLTDQVKNIDDRNVFISQDVYNYLPEEFFSYHELVTDYTIKNGLHLQYWKSISDLK